MDEILVSHGETNHGYGIIQSADRLYAISKCCSQHMYFSIGDDGPQYCYCSKCGTVGFYSQEIQPSAVFFLDMADQDELLFWVSYWTGIPRDRLEVSVGDGQPTV